MSEDNTIEHLLVEVKQGRQSLIELLRWACLDYDGAEMPDGAEPISINCGLLRTTADEIDECHAVILRQSSDISRLEMVQAALRRELRALAESLGHSRRVSPGAPT